MPFCIGSYSTLIGFYIEERGLSVKYVDPIADNPKDVVSTIDEPSIVLYAHNRYITYGYTGQYTKDNTFYCDIPKGSTIVDPWRNLPLDIAGMKVIHYGNTRTQ